MSTTTDVQIVAQDEERKKTSFVDLPPEIRNKVYEMALYDESVVVKLSKKAKIPALLAVHRLVRAEAAAIHYGTHEYEMRSPSPSIRNPSLVVESRAAADTVMAWILSVGPHVQYLRHLKILLSSRSVLLALKRSIEKTVQDAGVELKSEKFLKMGFRNSWAPEVEWLPDLKE